MKSAAIILARGGSKGIPKKNITQICGKPLIVWTIEHCLHGGVDFVYVSSDSDEILDIAKKNNALCIKRPENLSNDESTSESGWLHGLEIIEESKINLDWILAPQVTSPLRTANDIKNGIELAKSDKYDSIFSCSLVEDLYFWKKENGFYNSVNYDWKNRKRRQDFDTQYIENGSFYLFKPEVFRQNNNRFGGRIGIVEMDFWKMFEIDSIDDLRMCSALMSEFLLNNKK